MPIIRQLIAAGKTSRAVIIPKSWLEFLERENNCTISEVAIEVNGVLKVSPILPKKKVK